MGIRCVIDPGGLFPLRPDPASLDFQDLLDDRERVTNHPSFLEHHGQARPPGITEIEKLVNAGFGDLYSDQATAETSSRLTDLPGTPGQSRPYKSRRIGETPYHSRLRARIW